MCSSLSTSVSHRVQRKMLSSFSKTKPAHTDVMVFPPPVLCLILFPPSITQSFFSNGLFLHLCLLLYRSSHLFIPPFSFLLSCCLCLSTHSSPSQLPLCLPHRQQHLRIRFFEKEASFPPSFPPPMLFSLFNNLCLFREVFTCQQLTSSLPGWEEGAEITKPVIKDEKKSPHPPNSCCCKKRHTNTTALLGCFWLLQLSRSVQTHQCNKLAPAKATGQT